MHTKQQAAFVRETNHAISFADDKFQRSRTSEYKHIFGMLRGALLMGLPYEMYSSLYSHVWQCKFDMEVVDMEEPEQAQLDLVPVEPTEEMQIAGGRDQGFCSTCGYDNGGGDPAYTYTDMLAAAKAPPKTIYDEEVIAWEVTGFGVRPGVFTFKPGWAVDDPAYTVRELVYAQSRTKSMEVGHE